MVLTRRPAMATIKRRPPFDPKSFLAKIGEGRTISKYRKDQIVFSQGDPADAVFYVQKGRVKVTVVSDQGKEAVVAILGADEFCGEGCLAGQPRRMSTVTAMTECLVMRLEKTSIIRVLRDEPAFSEMIGTTRSRVSFFMNKFRRLGFVDYNGGGLEVHTSLLNVVLHD